MRAVRGMLPVANEGYATADRKRLQSLLPSPTDYLPQWDWEVVNEGACRLRHACAAIFAPIRHAACALVVKSIQQRRDAFAVPAQALRGKGWRTARASVPHR